MRTDAHCNHSVNIKCSIRMISRKYGCEQHEDGSAFSSLYSIAHVVLKVSSKDFISLSVKSVRTLMKGELTMLDSCSFYVCFNHPSSMFEQPSRSINTPVNSASLSFYCYAQTVWSHVQTDYDDINPDSDRNAYSNHLCRWIGLIRFQFESAQCKFRVDTINSN